MFFRNGFNLYIQLSMVCIKNSCQLFDSMIYFRYFVAIMGCFAQAILYAFKVNLGIAMVSMVNYTHICLERSAKFGNSSDNDDCNSTIAAREDGPFLWSDSIQGYVLSAYFWGYMVSQLPGGYIAEVVSATKVLLFAIFINVAGTLFSPIGAKCHFGVLIAIRVLQGIGGGVSFPAMHVLQSYWVPPSEKATINSIMYAGTSLGTVLSTLTAGQIAAHIGWEAIFYIMGGVSALWLILWLPIADSPERQRCFISETEKEYITSTTNKIKVERKDHPPFPFKSVMKSMPFWAILVANMCNDTGWYMLLIELPNYMKNVLKFELTYNSLHSSMPYLAQWLFTLLFSFCIDRIRARGWITLTWVRKSSTIICAAVPGLSLLAVSFVTSNPTAAVALLYIGLTTAGCMFVGFFSNHMDIASNFSGILCGITNTMGTIPGIIVPILIGILLEADPGIRSWRIIFCATTGLYLFETVFYVIFATANEQPWNQVQGAEQTAPTSADPANK